MRVQLISWALAVIYGLAVVMWLMWPQEVRIVDIEAAQELELAVPVYAQFIVSQTIVIPVQQRLKAIDIPMAIPESSQTITIRLQQGSLVIDEWRYQSNNAGVETVRFELERPVRVAGKLEVVIDGSQIRYDDRNQAPGVFVEPADYVYPDGNYRIGGNEKQGDVAMALIGMSSQGQRWLAAGETEPYENVAELVFVALGLTVLMTTPRILMNHHRD